MLIVLSLVPLRRSIIAPQYGGDPATVPQAGVTRSPRPGGLLRHVLRPGALHLRVRAWKAAGQGALGAIDVFLRRTGRRSRRSGAERAAANQIGLPLGHALEAETGFGPELLHGEAVGAGMAMAFDLSARLGVCSPADAARVRRHLGAVGLPVRLRTIGGDNRRTWDAARLIDHMRGDKKAEAGKLTFIRVHGIGQAFVTREVDETALRRMLDTAIAA